MRHVNCHPRFLHWSCHRSLPIVSVHSDHHDSCSGASISRSPFFLLSNISNMNCLIFHSASILRMWASHWNYPLHAAKSKVLHVVDASCGRVLSVITLIMFVFAPFKTFLVSWSIQRVSDPYARMVNIHDLCSLILKLNRRHLSCHRWFIYSNLLLVIFNRARTYTMWSSPAVNTEPRYLKCHTLSVSSLCINPPYFKNFLHLTFDNVDLHFLPLFYM